MSDISWRRFFAGRVNAAAKERGGSNANSAWRKTRFGGGGMGGGEGDYRRRKEDTRDLGCARRQ